MGQSQLCHHTVDLVVSYQSHDILLGGTTVKKGYFVSRRGMRITRSFEDLDLVLELFPEAELASTDLDQLVKERSQLEFSYVESRKNESRH